MKRRCAARFEIPVRAVFSLPFPVFRILRSLSRRLLISRHSSGGVASTTLSLTNRAIPRSEKSIAHRYIASDVFGYVPYETHRPFSHASDPFPPSDPPRSIDPDSWLLCPSRTIFPFPSRP